MSATETSAVQDEPKPWTMPYVDRGEIVWWCESPSPDGGECGAIVTNLGLRTVDLFIFAPGQGMPIIKQGVYHVDDPRGKKQQYDPKWYPGVWWKRRPISAVIEEIDAAIIKCMEAMTERSIPGLVEFAAKTGDQIKALSRRVAELEKNKAKEYGSG